MNPGIVLCSHLKSKRVPSKAIIPINGKPALWYLFKRFQNSNLPFILATPSSETLYFVDIFKDFKNIKYFSGSEKNVLERMYKAACEYNIDPIIRITHDDLLIDELLLNEMLEFYKTHHYKYMCSSQATDGIACEIISFSTLKEAYERNKDINVEHISYFVKEKEASYDYVPKDPLFHKKYRLTLDYPNDHLLLEILSKLTDLTNTKKILSFIRDNEFLLKVNDLPKITVFITCFNGSLYLREAIESIRKQTFQDFEFYFLDDGSVDDSLRIAASYDSIKILINSQNQGIAFSSNRILERAKGKYIIRLDSDDVLLPHALSTMYNYLESNPQLSCVYSGYYESDDKLNINKEITKNLSHHVGGSLFCKKALNELKFKDGLRHFDSQELFLRILKHFKWGYLESPMFLYRQHDKSWSRKIDNLEIRTKIKRDLGL